MATPDQISVVPERVDRSGLVVWLTPVIVTAAIVAAIVRLLNPAPEPTSVSHLLPDPVDPVSVRTATESEDCVTEIVADEYGFEVEVETCEADEAALLPGESALLPGEQTDADPTLMAIYTQVRDQVAGLGKCNGLPSGERQVVPGIDPETNELLQIVLAQTGQLQEACAGTEELRSGLVTTLRSVEDLAANISSGEIREIPDNASLNELEPLAMASIDRLFATTGKQMYEWRQSEYWFNSDEFMVLRNLKSLWDSGGEPTVVVAGSSSAMYAFDPTVLSGADSTIANVALAAGYPEVQAWFLPELAQLFPIQRLVWSIEPDSLHQVRCPREVSRAIDFDLRSVRERSFRYSASGPAKLRFISSGYDDTGLTRNIETWFEQGSLGDRKVYPSIQDDASAQSHATVLAKAAERHETSTVCAARVELIEATIVTLQQQGVEVALALGPTHPDLFDVSSAARDGLEEAIATIIEVAERTGTQIEALHNVLPEPEMWGDLSHASMSGRETTTAAMSQYLDQLGWTQ